MNDLAKAAARKSPEWLKRAVMYQLFLRAFTPEGTLKAAEKKLPELAKLGVDLVYLCPICLQDDDMRKEFWSARQKASGFENPRNPYRVKDYFKVDPEYGSDSDLKAFVETAHGLKMRVLLDIVYYHCGPTAAFLKEHRDFVNLDEKGEVAIGEWHFPTFNFGNPKLREYLWSNMEYWIEKFDVDGYRCDASDHVPLDFWEEGRRRVEALKPDAVLFSESGCPEHQLKAFDLNYGYEFHDSSRILSGSAFFQKIFSDAAAAFPKGAKFARHMDNHDIANDGSKGRVEAVLGNKLANAVLAAIFTLDGVPMLYNGQEAADKSKQSIFGKTPIDWSSGKTPEGKARKALLKSLCEVRRSERALTDGSLKWLGSSAAPSLIFFVREFNGERVFSIVNLSKLEAKAVLPDGVSLKPLLAVSAKAEGAALSLEPYGFLIGKA